MKEKKTKQEKQLSGKEQAELQEIVETLALWFERLLDGMENEEQSQGSDAEQKTDADQKTGDPEGKETLGEDLAEIEKMDPSEKITVKAGCIQKMMKNIKYLGRSGIEMGWLLHQAEATGDFSVKEAHTLIGRHLELCSEAVENMQKEGILKYPG